MHVRTAVVGVGGWGKNHLRVLSELDSLEALCDIEPERVKQYSSRYHVEGYTSVEELLKHPGLEAICICTPSSTHFEIASRCLERGLPIFVEKPLTPDWKEGLKLVAKAGERGTLLTVGYIERFNPAVARLKEMARVGELGELILLEVHRENRRPQHIRDVGIIVDTSVHDIDTARWVFHHEPRVVFARTGQIQDGHESFAAITLGFKGEKTAFLVSNWVTPKRVRELTAVFTEGVVSVDFVTQQLRIDGEGGTSIPRAEWEEPLKLELGRFLECIRTGAEPLVTGMDAINTSRVAEAAVVSSRTGAPIYLELERAEPDRSA